MRNKHVCWVFSVVVGALLVSTVSWAEDAPSKADEALAELDSALALVKTDAKAAGAVLKKLLTALSKKDAIPEDSTDHVGKYNRAVTEALRLGVRMSAKYRTKETRAQSGMLVFDVPLHTGWVAGRMGNQDQIMGWQRRGTDYAIEVQVIKINSTLVYSFPDGSTARGGDLKGMSQKRMERRKEDVAELIEAKSIRSCARKLGKGIGFVVKSVDKAGKKMRFREWQIKSKKDGKLVYQVVVFETGEVGEGDPEVDELLGSLQEKPKK